MRNIVFISLLMMLSSFELGCGASSESKLIKTGGQLKVNEVAYNYICFVRKDRNGSSYAYEAPVLVFARNPSLEANLVKADSTFYALVSEKRYELEKGAIYLVGNSDSSPRRVGDLVSEEKGNQSRGDLESRLRDLAELK